MQPSLPYEMTALFIYSPPASEEMLCVTEQTNIFSYYLELTAN